MVHSDGGTVDELGVRVIFIRLHVRRCRTRPHGHTYVFAYIDPWASRAPNGWK